jgi:hypothetical protein
VRIGMQRDGEIRLAETGVEVVREHGLGAADRFLGGLPDQYARFAP